MKRLKRWLAPYLQTYRCLLGRHRMFEGQTGLYRYGRCIWCEMVIPEEQDDG